MLIKSIKYNSNILNYNDNYYKLTSSTEKFCNKNNYKFSLKKAKHNNCSFLDNDYYFKLSNDILNINTNNSQNKKYNYFINLHNIHKTKQHLIDIRHWKHINYDLTSTSSNNSILNNNKSKTYKKYLQSRSFSTRSLINSKSLNNFKNSFNYSLNMFANKIGYKDIIGNKSSKKSYLLSSTQYSKNNVLSYIKSNKNLDKNSNKLNTQLSSFKNKCLLKNNKLFKNSNANLNKNKLNNSLVASSSNKLNNNSTRKNKFIKNNKECKNKLMYDFTKLTKYSHCSNSFTDSYLLKLAEEYIETDKTLNSYLNKIK